MQKPEPQPLDAGQAARPKAFRRPPHWVSPTIPDTPPASAATPPPSSSALTVAPAVRNTSPTPSPASEPTYGFVLIAIVILVNILVAFALAHLDDRSTSKATTTIINENEASPASPEVTLFSAPLEARRLTREQRLAESADETDQINTYHRTEPPYAPPLE